MGSTLVKNNVLFKIWRISAWVGGMIAGWALLHFSIEHIIAHPFLTFGAAIVTQVLSENVMRAFAEDEIVGAVTSFICGVSLIAMIISGISSIIRILLMALAVP